MSEPQQPQQPTAPETQTVPQQPYPPQQGYPPQQPYPPQQGYAAPPVQPGYPPQFPGLPPGSAVPPAGSNFSSGKGKTIGLIVAGVVAVGALGGIGALVLGGGDDDERPTASGGQNSGILDPEPVGTAAPVPAEPTEPTGPAEPTEPAEPSPTPEPEPPADPPAADGDFLTLPGNGLQVFVPAGWEAGDPGDFSVGLDDGNGAFGYVLTGSGDPSREAGALIAENLEGLLPSSSYTYELLNPQPLNPSGSIVSLASVEYQGTYIDAQSPLPVVGQIFGATRSDGSVLLILGEHGSADEFNASADDFNALLNETLVLFGGS